MGNRLANLKQAGELIAKRVGAIARASAIYETEAWGERAQDDFLNQAIEIHSSLAPADLVVTLLDIEQTMGRQRSRKWSPRSIDIDILFYGMQIVQQPNLQIPHPRIAERNFVLIPLMEIAANFEHPVLHSTIEQLYIQSTDDLDVRLYNTHALSP